MSEEKKEEKKLPVYLDGSNIVPTEKEIEEPTPEKKEGLEVGEVVVSEALQRRFDTVVGQRGDMERQRDLARKEREAAEQRAKELEDRLAALENKVTNPAPTRPGDDASPEDWASYTDAMLDYKLKQIVGPAQRQVQEQRVQGQNEADDAVANFASTHPDFAELHGKYWNQFMSNPQNVQALENSKDPLTDFYIMAKTQDAIDKISGTTIDLGARAAGGSVPTPPDRPNKKRDYIITDMEYWQYKKMFPGVNVTKDELDDMLRVKRGV